MGAYGGLGCSVSMGIDILGCSASMGAGQPLLLDEGLVPSGVRPSCLYPSKPFGGGRRGDQADEIFRKEPWGFLPAFGLPLYSPNL
jgi:hypothetical protein